MLRFLVLSAVIVSLTMGQSCPPNFVQFGFSCYFFIRSSMNWFDADQACTALIPTRYDVHLAAIENSSEQDFIAEQLRTNPDMRDRDAWISLSRHDKRRGWKWASTSQIPLYTNWAPGEPSDSGKCVHMWRDVSYQWDDVDCGSRKGAVCEYPLSPPPVSTNCPPDFVRNGNSCYYFVPTSLNWFDADQYCTSFRPGTYDVHLVSIESQSEQDFLVSQIRAANDLIERNYWTSANKLDPQRGWVWARTDQSVSFTTWAPGEPNDSGKCVQMWREQSWRWDDADCESSATGFICEVEV